MYILVYVIFFKLKKNKIFRDDNLLIYIEIKF